MIQIASKNKFFISILAMFAALAPFAVNTYTPAIPQIAEYFKVSQGEVIVTITTYFIGFAIGMLLWGAISDRYGRKKIIIIAMCIYIISTILSSLSDTFFILKVMRLIQGLSDSAGAIIAMSIARDCYIGKKLTATLASILIIMMIAPITAPIIGSILVVTTSKWQTIFYFLAAYGCLLLIVSLFIEETLDKSKRQNNIGSSIILYLHHLKNKKFVLISIASGLCFAGFFSFIGSSSIIFLEVFHTSYTLFCILYAINVIGVICANIIIKKLATKISFNTFTSVGLSSCFLGIIICILSYFLYRNVYLFTIGITIVTFGFSLSSTILIAEALNSVKIGFGAANSISNFLKFSLAGLSNFYMSLYTGNNLMIHLSYQQLFIVLIIALFFLAHISMKIKFKSSAKQNDVTQECNTAK